MTEQIIKVIDLVPGNRLPLTTVQARSLSEETFWTEFVCKHIPVIVKGAAMDWPALERWNRSGYLEGLCGDEIVDMWSTFNPAPVLDNATARFQKLVDGIEAMRKAPDDATYSIPAMPVPERWKPDLGRHSFLGKAHERAPLWYPGRRLFVYRNASTEWHYHPLDETITTQLLGSKRISLFRLTAENWQAFVPLIEANWHHLSCRAHFFPPQAIAKYEGVLEAGDAVYIPPFWWHGIDPADTGLGATLAHCFRSPARRFGAWEEPATQELIRVVARSHKMQLLPLLALVCFSSIRRKLDRETWWPTDTPSRRSFGNFP
jgi:hypothetical protein